MSGRGRAVVAIGAVAAVVVLFFVFRSGGGDDDQATPPATTAVGTATTETAAETETTAPVETEPPAPPPPPAGPVRALITFRGGEVVGGRQLLKVQQGKQMVLVIDADVADEVHLHGYDLMVDVAAGKPARLRFEASIAGRFEIELEDRAIRLGQLEVRP